MQTRKASIKETGEELSQAEWARFDAAVAAARIERRTTGHLSLQRPRAAMPDGTGPASASGARVRP